MRTWLLSLTTITLSLACQRRVPTPTPTAPPAVALLDSMDTRVPVPLLPMMANHQKQNMRDHLRAVQEIVAAVGASDFDAVTRAAARIGYSEQMGQMCNHMGAGAPGFTDQALRFHHTADKIGAAAISIQRFIRQSPIIFVPPLVLLIVGWVLGWILRGFRVAA